MKKYLCFILSALLLLSLFGCANGQTSTPSTTAPTTPPLPNSASGDEVAFLESLYEGRTVFHGQLHEHAKTGRGSDGKNTLDEWKAGMPGVGMDYVAILDHKQTDHMYLPEWDPTLFICGTEAGTYITDRPSLSNKFHYNMMFPSVKEMEAHLNQFKEYVFSNGLFVYPNFSTERFLQVIQSVLDKGGYFVIPHPMQTLATSSADPLDYYFCDHIGMEVFYCIDETDAANARNTAKNYELWRQILAQGKRVYASSGCDSHKLPSNRALSTIYTDQQLNTAYLPHLRAGDYTAGPVGIRMAIGETKMGGTTSFSGNKLVFSVGDFHKDLDPNHTYRVVVHSDRRVVFRQEIPYGQTSYFSLDIDENAKFYRIEIYDTNLDYPMIAVGNPIWNEAFYQ